MPEERQRERDLILSPNEFAFISDQTKGNINVYVGPYKASLSNTDQPILFNQGTKRFEKCILEHSIQPFAIAPEGWYLTLKNPAKDNSNPKTGTVNNLGDLIVGHKVNIPGPISFPLWPGQMVNVLKGHHLRSNQYLVIRVYDEKAARENWNKAVIKSQGEGKEVSATLDINKVGLGDLFIIKGTEVSFYIPPTGMEVVKDQGGNYRRNAVTLERLEYCILLDENGNKRYVRGPEVVFPEPTEVFIQKDGVRKFKAIELSEIKGIYLKVIAPYIEGNPGTPEYKEYKEGDELFITGKDMMIYFPRKEHAIVKYDGSEIHYAVAIPAGTARYVMNRLTGEVTLRQGPDMFLPDPRVEVIVRRILDPKQVDLWFPGNVKAKEINEELKIQALKEKEAMPATATTGLKKGGRAAIADVDDEISSEAYTGDSFERKNKYTPPRTITLDTKYEGAVSIDVWTGYAIMVVGKFKDRKVIVGPATYLLEFDEYLEVISLSTGNPKNDNKLIKDVYLRILNNQVSDTIDVETNDFVNIQLKLSYRLNFINDSSAWFNVENYVKFLTDRFRSIYRSTVKNYSVEEFYKNAYQIIKKTILGDDLSTGYFFKENNVHVYDVEILDVVIQDAGVAKMMIESQQTLIQQTTTFTREKAKLEITKFLETIKQESAKSQYETKKLLYDYEKEDVEKKLTLDVSKLESDRKTKEIQLDSEKKEEEGLSEINTIRLGREKSIADQDIEIQSKELELKLKELESEVKAMVDRANAISPDLISALQAFGDKQLLERLAESMAPLAILGGESVADVFARLMKGTKLEGVFLNVGSDILPKIIKKNTEGEV
ncbi:MAG: hypothetical protein KDK36_22365 [Leptospiraceae bacterium]|nr:hypothetical protein [Leptospiraceae bacterium]